MSAAKKMRLETIRERIKGVEHLRTLIGSTERNELDLLVRAVEAVITVAQAREGDCPACGSYAFSLGAMREEHEPDCALLPLLVLVNEGEEADSSQGTA